MLSHLSARSRVKICRLTGNLKEKHATFIQGVRTNEGFVYSNNIVVYGLNGITFQEARAVQELNREGHGCQMAIATFLDCMCLALWAEGLWLRHATLQNLIPSFPWIAPGWRVGVQSKERKGSNFAA